jgi:uncharacterized protein YjiK
MPYFLLIFTAFFSVSCGQNKYSSEYFRQSAGTSFPYNLGSPSARYDLEQDLHEISGLEWYKPGMLACIQDEKGFLFLLDTASGKVIRKIKFSGNGDYESIALAGDYAFILESNGNLYSFPITVNDKVDADKTITPFKSNNNMEGLCYCPADSSLIMLCKNDAGIEEKLKGMAAYKFDLRSGNLDRQPFIHISKKKFDEKLEFFHLDQINHYPFHPSGIAINPVDGNYYIIASVGKILIVLDHEKNIIKMVPLPGEILAQPEGISFSPEGDLFISSEGRGGNGYILKFRMEELKEEK